MKIVTSGYPYIDIDAYASCVAYAELLNLQKIPAAAASSATLNESITSTIRSWNVPFESGIIPGNNDTFILVDVSDPEHFDNFVVLDKVEEVIDHHPRFEKQWEELIGSKAQIDFIGSAATLVYEKWEDTGLQYRMSTQSARLLVCAILDNTLNFKALVTTERDRLAYKKLLKVANLPKDWTAQYFEECQAAILSNVKSAISNDTKMLNFTKLPIETIAVGQLVIWDATEIINKHNKTIKKAMEQKKPEWFVNIVSVNEGKSYYMSENNEIKKWAERVLGVSFDGSIAQANRLWLRKEIIKQDIMDTPVY